MLKTHLLTLWGGRVAIPALKLYSPPRYRWLIILILGAGLFAWHGSRNALSAQQVESDPFMQRQAAAMQPHAVVELNVLAGVPRYTLAADLDTYRGIVQGTMDVGYTNRSRQSLSEIVFRLYPNANETIGGGQLTVHTVHQEGSVRPWRLSLDRTSLRVRLATLLPPGGKTTLRLAFTTKVSSFRANSSKLLYRQRGILSLTGWYPILAVHTEEGWLVPSIPAVETGLATETSLYEVTLTVPSSEQVIATGSVLAKENSGYRTQWRLVSGPVREFTIVTGRNFSTHTLEVANTEIRLHALPTITPPAMTAEEALATAASYFQIYTRRFGPYPFAELDVVETPFSAADQGFSGLLQLQQALRGKGSPSEYHYRLAHEIAHQWWFNLVGNDALAEPWLDEALATYAAVIAWSEVDGIQTGNSLIDHWTETYGLNVLPEAPLDTPAADFENRSAYLRVIHYQGALFLHQLRQEVGDDMFFERLQHYQRAYRYDIAGTEDFLRTMEIGTGRFLGRLFAQWFANYGAGSAQITQ